MAWLSFGKKKTGKTASKEKLWNVCTRCKAHIYKTDWDKSVNVCPKCGFHDRISSKHRIDITLDTGSFQELFGDITTNDPLEFSDAKGPYSEKALATVKKTGLNESVVTGKGRIKDIPVVISVMDFSFMGGSMGSGTGEKILLAANYALKYKLPYIIFSASGGARMHEGIISLMQMARTSAGIARLKKAGIPYISVLTHPTTGGVSASFAMLGDINVAEPGVLIGFAGRRVIEETIKQKLPDDFQTAEYLLEHGFIDKIVSRGHMKDFLANVLRYWNRK